MCLQIVHRRKRLRSFVRGGEAFFEDKYYSKRALHWYRTQCCNANEHVYCVQILANAVWPDMCLFLLVRF